METLVVPGEACLAVQGHVVVRVRIDFASRIPSLSSFLFSMTRGSIKWLELLNNGLGGCPVTF